MMRLRMPADAAVRTAMLGAGVFTAQFVGGKAARDALYLRQLPVTTLPAMIAVTSVATLAGVALTSQAIKRVSSSRFVSLLFQASAVLLILEWMASVFAPRAIAIIFYLHTTGLGPMLGSGFWLVATERFDPHTAKQRFGQIAAAGTIGGLIGGLLAYGADTFATMTAMLPLLAVMNLFCAFQVQRLAAPAASQESDADAVLMSPEPRSAFRVLAEAPYLRNLAALVLLGTIGAGLVDYVFKAQAATLGRADRLGRFFAIYYAAVSVVTFIVQTSFSRRVLEKLGLAAATGAPSIALVAGSLAGLFVAPLRRPLVIGARGGEAILRGSLFRSGYEVFYTPLAVTEKRAAKSLIDVGCDRFGELLGAGGIQLALLAAPAEANVTILVLGIATSAAAALFANRLNHGYVSALERSLLNRAVELDLSDVEDLTTKTVMLRALDASRATRTLTDASLPIATQRSAQPAAGSEPQAASAAADPHVRKIVALRSRDRRAILEVLEADDELAGPLVPHVIPLLAWDPVAEYAVRALRGVAEYHVGELTDALLDPNQPFAVRRRLARVFSVCVSQRAVDGLIAALDDLRFEVRYQCARSLAAIAEKNARVRFDPATIYAVVQREVEVGRPVWESRRLLDRTDDDDTGRIVDDYLRGRASKSLTHVFTLLSLVIPAEPLRIAFRGLHTSDPNLRGTSLEYLEGVLPAPIHRGLRPFLEDRPARPAPARPREEVLAELLRSSDSILLNLEELKQSVERGKAP